MDNDDRQIGRLLSRREALALIGAASAAMLAGCGAASGGITQATSAAGTAAASLNPEAATAVATAAASPGLNETAAATTAVSDLPTCVVSPEQTVGPYYADVQLNRSDIRSDTTSGTVKEGLPFVLTMRVSQISANSCTPIEGATVEIWHCDAGGVYSAFEGEGTANENFLRGHQVTDANGQVQFTTIYPGWYRGRAVHIHFKVRTTGSDGNDYEFTSQMYFDDTISDQIYTQAPYTGHSGQRDTTNANDGIYSNGGDQLMIALAQANQGYNGTFHIGLDLADASVGAADTMGGGPGGPGGPPPRP
ncbi:MAG: intradiol ring-cleavage dioxygenase [Chloroflexi bacterium]|nr:intradiol ring-cleavage dioxygenase [Chloroflexota bacterium]